MTKTILPSTNELKDNYRKLIMLTWGETQIFDDYTRVEQILDHWKREASIYPKVESGRGYLTLPPRLALRFKETNLRKFPVQPDIYFAQTWSDKNKNDPFINLDLKLRIWVPGRMSRRDVDHPDLANNGWRVGLRIHFDRCANTQRMPRYHFQAGGKPEINERCQLYKEIEEPRVPIWPIDFALAIQMVLKGFFPMEYHQLVQKDQFRICVRQSEQWFVKPVLDWIMSYQFGGNNNTMTLLEYFCR